MQHHCSSSSNFNFSVAEGHLLEARLTSLLSNGLPKADIVDEIIRSLDGKVFCLLLFLKAKRLHQYMGSPMDLHNPLMDLYPSIASHKERNDLERA